MYKEVDGDLISLAKNGEFDVIAHGNNCLCNMGAGIAPKMDIAFGCGNFELEQIRYRGDINKLGQIDYQKVFLTNAGRVVKQPIPDMEMRELVVVNCYTQFYPAAHLKPLDYEALTLCFRKMNKIFAGKKIGIPRIGAGLAGGAWNRIKRIIETEMSNCDVTVVLFKIPGDIYK